MGYTHYFSFNAVPRGKVIESEKAYQKAIIECARTIRYYSETFGGLAGFSAHCEPRLYGGIDVNGSKRVGQCENFVLREHLKQNEASFCKTARLPYDTVVTACLIILKHRLGSLINVTSDGSRDEWNDGLILVQKVLKLKRIDIPESIEPSVLTSQDKAV